jgi:hypothetical protein
MLLIKKRRTSQVVFKAGKNQDGYFDNDNLVDQVKFSMDILKKRLTDSNAPYSFSTT